MKKILTIILIALLLVAGCVAVSGCARTVYEGTLAPNPDTSEEDAEMPDSDAPEAEAETEVSNTVISEPEEVENPTIEGVWIWDGEEVFAYYFADNGTGGRGTVGPLTEFTWSTTEEGKLILDVIADSREEIWIYELDGDVLLLTLRQIDGENVVGDGQTLTLRRA